MFATTTRSWFLGLDTSENSPYQYCNLNEPRSVCTQCVGVYACMCLCSCSDVFFVFVTLTNIMHIFVRMLCCLFLIASLFFLVYIPCMCLCVALYMHVWMRMWYPVWRFLMFPFFLLFSFVCLGVKHQAQFTYVSAASCALDYQNMTVNYNNYCNLSPQCLNSVPSILVSASSYDCAVGPLVGADFAQVQFLNWDTCHIRCAVLQSNKCAFRGKRRVHLTKNATHCWWFGSSCSHRFQIFFVPPSPPPCHITLGK